MPAVPVPPDIAPGIPSTSAFSQLRDAIRFSQSPPRFDLRQTVAQSLANNTEVPIDFDTEDEDTDIDNIGGHSGGSPTLWVCRYPGTYLLHGKVAFLANATNIRIAWIQVNGIDVGGSANTVSGTTAFDPGVPTNAKKVPLEEDDQVRLMGFQNSGGALNTFVGGGSPRYQSTLSGLWVAVL